MNRTICKNRIFSDQTTHISSGYIIKKPVRAPLLAKLHSLTIAAEAVTYKEFSVCKFCNCPIVKLSTSNVWSAY